MTGRPPSCLCDECPKCRRRHEARARYQALSAEERRALIARRDREKIKAADKARYERDKTKRLQLMRKIHERYRGTDKWRARHAVSNALRDGKILRPDECQKCGHSCKPEAHHDDYSRPLDVRWLCSGCHGEEHRRYAA